MRTDYDLAPSTEVVLLISRASAIVCLVQEIIAKIINSLSRINHKSKSNRDKMFIKIAVNKKFLIIY